MFTHMLELTTKPDKSKPLADTIDDKALADPEENNGARLLHQLRNE